MEDVVIGRDSAMAGSGTKEQKEANEWIVEGERYPIAIDTLCTNYKSPIMDKGVLLPPCVPLLDVITIPGRVQNEESLQYIR